MKNLISIGMFLIVVGFVVVFIGALQESVTSPQTTDRKPQTKVAFGGFIGPIPFGWANDKRLFYPLMGFLIALAVFWTIWQLMRKI